MGLLDEVMNGNDAPELDNLTFRMGKTLPNLGKKMAELTQPQTTTTSLGTVGKPLDDWATENIRKDEANISYMENKVKQNALRHDRYSDSIVSDQNLSSDSLLIRGAANVANLAAKAAGSLANIPVDVADGLLQMKSQFHLGRIPTDVADILDRQDNVENLAKNTKDLQALRNALKYDPDMSADDRKDTQAKIDQLSLKVNSKAPTAAELARTEGTSTDSALTWKEYYKDAKGLAPDQEARKNNPYAPENWGNDFATRNFEEINKGTITDKDGFLSSVGKKVVTAVANPSIVSDAIAGSAAYMNPYTVLPASVGMGLDAFDRGVTQKQKESGSSALSGGDLAKTAGVSAAIGGLGFAQGKIEASALVGQFGKGLGRGAGSVADGVAKTLNNASKATVGKLGLPGAIAHGAGAGLNVGLAKAVPVVGRIGATAAAEGLTEGGESILDQALTSNLIRTDVLSDSVALGAASGGVIATPGGAVGGLVDAFADRANAQNEAQFGSVETSDESLLDPTQSTFNPNQSVQRAAASVKGVMPTTEGSAGTYDTAKATVDNAYKAATNAFASTKEIADRLGKSEEMQTKLTNLEAYIEGIKSDTTIDEETREKRVTSATGALELGLKRLEEVKNAEADTEGFTKLHAKNEAMLKDTEKSYTQFMGMYNNNAKAMAEANKPTDAEVVPNTPAEEANTLLGAPSFGNVERMMQLAEDNNIDELVRRKLRVVADVVIAENKLKNMDNITDAVTNGTEGYRGLSEYVSMMQEAVANNDIVNQQIMNNQLNSFSKSMSSKAAVAQEAFAEANRRYAEDPLGRTTDFDVQMVFSNDSKSWEIVTDGPLSKAKLKKNSGLTIHAQLGNKSLGSLNLVNAIVDNAAAIQKTQEALGLIQGNQSKRQQSPLEVLDSANTPEEFAAAFEQEGPESDLDLDQDTQVDPFDIEDEFAIEDSQDFNGDAIESVDTVEVAQAEAVEETPALTEEAAKAAAAVASKTTGKKFKAVPVMGGFGVEEVTADTKPENKKADAVDSKPKVNKKKKEERIEEQDLATSNEVYEDADVEAADVKSKTKPDGKVDESPEGALSVLATDGKSYKEAIAEESKKDGTEQNKVKLGFVQRLRTGSNSPLVEVKDVFSKLASFARGDGNAVAKFIAKYSEIGKPTKQQIAVVTDALNFANTFNKAIAETLAPKGDSRFFNESYIDYLYTTDEQGKKFLDENVRTAMSIAAYDWMAGNSNTVIGTLQDIANKVWMPEAKILPEEAYALLGDVGTYRNEVIKMLGQKAMASLQLRQLGTVEQEATSKLTMALGAVTLAALENGNYVETTNVNLQSIQMLRKEIEEQNEDVQFKKNTNLAGEKEVMAFIRPRVLEFDEEGRAVVDKRITAIANFNKDAPTTLAAVFGFTPELKLPSDKPIKTVPTTFDDLKSTVPALQKEVILKSQSRPYIMASSMVHVIQQIGGKDFQAMLDLMGFRSLSTVLKSREMSVRSQNEEVERSMYTMFATYENLRNGDMYLENTVWSNMRSGIDSAFNPQANRIHRAFSSLKSDIITVPHDVNTVYDSKGELTKYGMFLRGLGYRMEDAKNMAVNGDIAKNYLKDWLPAFDSYVNSEEVQVAVDAVTAFKEERATKADFKKIQTMLGTWGNGADGLSVLNALSDRNMGIASKTDYESNIPVESDGSNNGPAFTQTLFDTGTERIMNSVGVYYKGQTYAGQPKIDMVSYRADGGLDMYEQLAVLKEHFMASTLKEYNKAVAAFKGAKDSGVIKAGNAAYAKMKTLQAVNTLDNLFTGRKGAKRDLVPFNYGAGMAAVKRGSSKAFMENILDQVESAALKGDTTAAKNIAQNVNQLIQSYNYLNNSKVQLVVASDLFTLDADFTPSQVQAIRAMEEKARGEITENSLNTLLASYIVKRTQATTIANVAYDAFKPMYDTELQVVLEEYYAANPEAKRSKENIPKAVHDKVMKSLRNYMPKLDVAMGLHNKQFNQVAIPVMGTAKVWSNQNLSVPYINSKERKVRTLNLTDTTYFKKYKPGKANMTVGVEEMVLESPGASALAKYIQSHDAYVNFMVMNQYSVQNYHDASPINPYQANELAQYQNKAFLEAVSISHIGEAFSNALLAPLQAYADGKVDLSTQENRDALADILASLRKPFDSEPEMSDRVVVMQVLKTMLSSDVTKMEKLVNETAAINQYATEGGHFTIDAETTKVLNVRKGELKSRIRKIEERANKIFDAIESSTAGKRTVSVMTERKLRDEARKKEDGFIFKSEFEKAIWNDREKLTDPKELLKYLHKNIAEHLGKEGNIGRYANVYRDLLRASASSLGGVKINIFFDSEINDDNKPIKYDEALSSRKGGLHAWYARVGNKREINIRLGTTDVVNTSVIVHEMIHAASADSIKMIEQERASKVKESAYSKSANNAYDNLLSNYETVKLNVERSTNLERNPIVDYGITELSEFIATAFTYPEFAEYLSKMTVPAGPHARKGATSSMLREVMTNLIGLFRGIYGGGSPSTKTKEVSALEAMIIDTSMFMEQTNPKSDSGGFILGAPTEKALDSVSVMTATEVLNALPSTGNTALDATLNSVLTNVTEKVLSKLPRDYKGNNQYSPENIWNNALESGEAPYQSEAVQVGFTLSDREQFALEATELAVAESLKDKGLSELYGEIERIYTATRENTKVADLHQGEWANATKEQRDTAQAKYDYVFGSGKYSLPRFIAMSLTTAEVGNLANFHLERERRNTSENEYFDKVFMYVDKAVDKFLDSYIGSNAPNAGMRLNSVMNKMIDVDNKSRNKVFVVTEIAGGLIDDKSNKAVKYVAGKIVDVADTYDPKTTAGKIIKNLTKSTLTGKPLAIADVIAEGIDKSNPNQTLGFIGEMNKEFGTATSQQRTAEKLMMAQKKNETEAQRLRTAMKQNVLSLFKDGGTKLTKATKEAVTKGLLRTDVQSLVNTYSLDQVKNLLSTRTELNREIKSKKQGISSMHNFRAKLLAWYMVSNKGHKLLAKSALAIASDVGLVVRGNPDPKYVQQLDELVSLYALRYTDKGILDNVVETMNAEKDGKSYGGIEAVLKFHKGLAQDSRTVLFDGTEFNYTKGYMPEITNPNKELVVAETPADVDRLRSAMYTELGPVKTDPKDPSTFVPIMFYTEDAASQKFVSGAMPLYAYGAKGSKLNLDPKDIIDAMNDVRGAKVDEDYDPRADDEPSMIPLYDSMGMVTDLRYEMSSFRRDSVLERNNDFSDMLGAFAAIGYTKVMNEGQALNVIEALHDDYSKASPMTMNKYVYVSYESSDPVAFEAWNRLSREAKEHVKSVWGNYGMWVSNDAFLTVFGYPKKSLLTEAFGKDANMRNFGEEMYVTVMKAIFRDNARIAGARTEKMWQEMVALSKNFVVIRNVSTLLTNVASNSFLLMAHGVPLSDIIKNTRESIRGGMQYRKDIAMLTKLETNQRAGIGNVDELQKQIETISARMQRNPMQGFIDKGMFSGIVEDIDPSQDMYSYQSGLQRKFDNVYNKVPKLIRRTAEYAFVTPSTPLYQFLHSSTQYSDFSAKYVLYKHLTEKKGMKEDAAIFEAQDNFINYDVPTSPWLQYANDMGIVMFTKYNIRIQKALFKLLAQRPAAAISQAIMLQQVTTLPYGIDPILFNQYGNPFRDGAFGLLGTWDQAFPIKAVF